MEGVNRMQESPSIKINITWMPESADQEWLVQFLQQQGGALSRFPLNYWLTRSGILWGLIIQN